MRAEQQSLLTALKASALPQGPRPHNPVKAEIDRLDRNALRVLARLKEGSATNVELCTKDCGGLNAVRSRIPALRKQGWVITAERVKDGVFRYTLKGLK